MKHTAAELLAKIQEDLKPYKLPLGAAADTIVSENVSNYPIFIIHKQELEIGIPIVDRIKQKMEWSVNASTLEEFVAKQLIEPSKVEDFKKVFKPVDSQLCLFILSELGATFVFMPRI